MCALQVRVAGQQRASFLRERRALTAARDALKRRAHFERQQHEKSDAKVACMAVDTVRSKARQRAPLLAPIDLEPAARRNVAAALNGVLADVFALCLKTNNFHWP